MDSKLDADSDHECGDCPLLAVSSAEPNGISRRDFLSAAMLTSIAATLAACGGGDLSPADRLLASTGDTTTTKAPVTTPAAPGTPTVGANQFGVTVANYPALAVAGGVAVVRTSPAIALARTGSGFVAYSLSCTHEGTTVRLLSNRTLQCPNHGAVFSSTGAWAGGFRTSSLRSRSVTASADLSFVVVSLS